MRSFAAINTFLLDSDCPLTVWKDTDSYKEYLFSIKDDNFQECGCQQLILSTTEYLLGLSIIKHLPNPYNREIHFMVTCFLPDSLLDN